MKKLCWNPTKACLYIRLPRRRGSLCAAWGRMEGRSCGAGISSLFHREGPRKFFGRPREAFGEAARYGI